VHLGKIALREAIREHGPDHLVVANALVQIGNAYGQFGDAERQREYLEKALELDTSRYDIYVDLAKAYCQLGRLGEQRRCLQHAAHMIKKQYGDEHEDLAPIFIILGDMHGDVKIPVDWAENWGENLEHQLIKHAAARDLTVDEIRNMLTVTDKCRGELLISYDAEGQPVLEKRSANQESGLQGLAETASAHSRPRLDSRHSRDKHGDSMAELSHENHAGSASPITVEEVLQPEEEAIVWSDHFPLLVQAEGNAAQQREYYERALFIQEIRYGPDHCELVVPLTKLGNAWGRLGEVERKYLLLDRALSIQVKELGPKHREVAVIKYNLSHALYALGEHEEAIAQMKIAKNSLHANFGEKHRNTQAAVRALKYWSQVREKATVG